jgi:hypothetical protein
VTLSAHSRDSSGLAAAAERVASARRARPAATIVQVTLSAHSRDASVRTAAARDVPNSHRP